ncbi:hypothetical protein Q4I32_008258 [Leishmania shawi]|uniref:Uncharacterized protein n=1 Tax=Leishmania shawi TaxID=5680 RepID=A0AAW3B877_9TRYP
MSTFMTIDRMPGPPHQLPSLGALDPIVRDIVLRLHAKPSASADGPRTEDAAMLLAALLHFYTKAVSTLATLPDVSKGTLDVPPLTDQLQCTLAPYYSGRAVSAPSVKLTTDVMVRAALLHVVTTLVFSSRLALCRSGAALTQVAERATEQVTMATAPVTLSSMLHALVVL